MDQEGIEKWISEILVIWNDSSLLGKIVMIFACIGASTTLTSLSGIIVEWKGLIAEMLYFYRQNVRDPIASAFCFVTFNVLRPTGPLIDAILLYLIYFSAEKRVFGKLSERSAINFSMFIVDVIMFPLALLSFILILLFLVDRYLISGVWIYADKITMFYFLIWILLSIAGQIHYLKRLSRGKNYPKHLVPEDGPKFYMNEIRNFVKFVTPMIIAFLVLVLLASINSGLS
jgi:hypothetical protein